MADQKRTDLDWDDVRVFLAVARKGSLSAAARLLGVNHATVSRRLQSLERRTGSAPLFEKTRGGYVLTSAGELACKDAEAMEAAADSLRLCVQRGDQLTGPVRISATATFAEHVLVEPLVQIALDQPGLRIELGAEDRNVSLSRGEADIALRLGRPLAGDAVARSVGTVDYYLYATDAYLEAHPEKQLLIGYSGTVADSAPGVRRLKELAGETTFAICCPTLTAQAKAAAAGAGMALLPSYLAPRHPTLRRIDEQSEPDWSHPLWLVVRSDVRRVRRVRFVADRLMASLEGAFRPGE